MSKHTPGPWSFYDDSNDGKTNRIEIVGWGKTVARIYHSVPEEDLPNARLIAAAPDLLEALKMAQFQIENQCDVGVDEWIACREKARAAIARVEGEQT